MNVTLRPRAEALVHECVSRGEFSSPEELVELALEYFLSETPEELLEMRQAVEEALHQEGGQPAREVFGELRAKYGISR